LSLLFNLISIGLFAVGCLGPWFRGELGGSGESSLDEVTYAGTASAEDKVAVISLDGVIVEGLLGYVHREIDQAARDSHVKAVVLRVNSPGGSVTASDDLHQRLSELAHGNPLKGTPGKTLVASFGSLAASGGYYAAMPAQAVYAERSTLTGSIGVFAALPNVTELANKVGVKVQFIKQGEIKDSGSPFKDMTTKERQVWQDLIDHAYQQFLQVVEEGRPALKEGGLLARRDITPVRAGPAWLAEPQSDAPAREPKHKHKPEAPALEPQPDAPAREPQPDAPARQTKPGPYTRYLADGGVWTADMALAFHLIDKIGRLDDAIQEAHDRAGLGPSYRVIRYARPRSVAQILLGIHAPAASGGAPSFTLSGLSPSLLDSALTPRLWYLAPGHWTATLTAGDDGMPR
jgi:protease-4